jgi:hypothetical protein
VPDGVGLELEQSKLRADVQLVRDYGDAHPEAWVEVRFENEPTVRIVALFAGGGVTHHEQALRRLVAHPDQLEVRPSPWTRVRLEEIRTAVHDLATSSEPGLFGGSGIGHGQVDVRLRADGERVAGQLRARYGDGVDITVGFLHFPGRAFRHPHRPPMPADPAGPGPSPLPDELRVGLDGELEVETGADLWSTIRLVNEGRVEVVALTNGQLTARVVDPETHEIVGGFSGNQALPLVRFRAPAGGSVDIPVLIGTASTVPRLGYAVPTGEWALEITFPFQNLGPSLAPLLPLRVVA